jgi:hypothetical protein
MADHGNYHAQKERARAIPAGGPISRRSMLTGSMGVAALIASRDLFASSRALAATAPPAAPAARHFFVYGIPGPAPGPNSSVQAAPVAPVQVAAQLAALPVQSPDQATLALATVAQGSAGATLTLTLIDAVSAAARSRGVLPLPGVPADASITVTPVFSADSTVVALVLAITLPSNARTITKVNPLTGGTVALPGATWTSYHALAYFDLSAASFSGPFDLADRPSLALSTAAADSSDLYLWTLKEPAAVRSGKGDPGSAPVPQLTVYPLGSGTARLATAASSDWPTGGEPVVPLAAGGIARLVRGRDVEVYSASTGGLTQVTLGSLAIASAKPGAVSMRARPDGTVLVADPAIGRAVVADPADSFREVSVISFPAPALPIGGPAGKIALSADGGVVYVLGGAGAGGLSAYTVATGALTASYSDGEQYSGVYVLPSGTVLAVRTASPRLAFFGASLAPIGTADTDLNVTAVF